MRSLTKITLSIFVLACLPISIAFGQQLKPSAQDSGTRCSRLKKSKAAKPTGTPGGSLMTAAKKGLDGGFIQLWSDMVTGMNDSQWESVLNAMRDAGLRIIIIQYLRHNNDKLFPADPRKFDPTEKVLKYADKHRDMQVFLGIGYDTSWYDNWRSVDFINSLVRRNNELASELWTRYGTRHTSFAGWYVPQEMWNENYTESEINHLRDLYYTRVINHCKSLAAGKPVSVSPYFNPLPKFIGETETPAQNAERFAQRYAQFLTGSGIDIVMLQDSVGARNIEGKDFNDKVKPYYEAFSRLCAPKIKELWANLESFRTLESGERRPADHGRFSQQVEMFAPFGIHVVTFEFFHYMNPYGHLKTADYKLEQETLYKEYVKEFVVRR